MYAWLLLVRVAMERMAMSQLLASVFTIADCNPSSYIILHLLAFAEKVCYSSLVIHITNRISGIARYYTVVLLRLHRI